jgi:hypothetical protein
MRPHIPFSRSFGLLLALLSKSRSTRQTTPRYWHQRAQQQVLEKPAISSWLIVPHNDLAHQFIHWIGLMKLAREPEQVAQTLLREGKTNRLPEPNTAYCKGPTPYTHHYPEGIGRMLERLQDRVGHRVASSSSA